MTTTATISSARRCTARGRLMPSPRGPSAETTGTEAPSQSRHRRAVRRWRGGTPGTTTTCRPASSARCSLRASKAPSRCTPMEGWDTWDYNDVQTGLLGEMQPPRLEVTVTPHRIEGAEHLVCSLRQFLVVVSMVDGATSAPLPTWDAPLRASLVYADNGE